MKKGLALLLAVVLAISAFSALACNAEENELLSENQELSFDTYQALYAHGLLSSDDTEAWVAWQCEHDEDFNEVNPNVKYFFLPTSADENKVDIYNAYSTSVIINGVEIASGEKRTVDYDAESQYPVMVDNKSYTVKFMKSNAEAGIYLNNSDADGNGTELMRYLNQDKSLSAAATGAIVTPDGSVDNTPIKKIKGRGNTTWSKPKKAYNITYDGKVSIAGMNESKKYSLLANYQDDTLSRNRFLYDLSDAVGMPYASDSRYVDVYSNGFYWGSFQMAEKVEAGGKNDLVNDIDTDSYLNEDGTINKDFPFVCEIDASAGSDDYYVETSNNKITIKAPEINKGEPGYDEVRNYVAEKFTRFYVAIRNKSSDLSEIADVDSITKLYLINELGKNWDSGVSSTFFTYKQDENGVYKFYGSPVWDYDNSLGNAVGIEGELRSMGVSDYEEYYGWWCKYKGKTPDSKKSRNVMNNISRHTQVIEAAPKIWFENFVPALKDFCGETDNGIMMSADEYYDLIKDSAEMNYQSGWLLKTGDWVCDHTSPQQVCEYNPADNTLITSVKTYENDFDGMFEYCTDWMLSRTAWLTTQMYDDYTPPKTYDLGDVNLDGTINILDATEIQKSLAKIVTLNVEQETVADTNNDGIINILDATQIQKYLAKLVDKLG